MKFGLIIVGDEILSGKRKDQHLPKVIELLGARGLSLAWARYAGDDRQAITRDLSEAWRGVQSDADVVFSCGGIGATPDDHTRQSAGLALDLPLVLHPGAAERITVRMRELATERGTPFVDGAPENIHRLNMGVFPKGADLIENPYNRIPGFVMRGPIGGGLYFVPGFPVMAWPMIESVLDGDCAALHSAHRPRERSVIVFGAMEASLTPLMEQLEAEHAPVKVFSLPSVDHPQYGRHIELGVKLAGPAEALDAAYRALLAGLHAFGASLGPELVR